jgi:hypothetical protein
MKMLNKIIGGSVIALAAFALNTQAQNLLTDGSFENGNIVVTVPAGAALGLGDVGNGWDSNFGGATIVESDMSSATSAPLDGVKALLTVNAVGNNWNPVGTYQLVGGGVNGVNINVGSTYTLSVYGLQDSATPLSGTYGTPIDIQLQFFNAALVNVQTTETGWSALGAVDTWKNYTVTGTAPAGAVYAAPYIMFMDNGQTSPDIVYFDMATLTVPEPSTLALLSLGLAVPFYFIRRRKS